MSVPATTLYLCSGVKITNDYKHTIWFNNTAEQLTYFQSKVVKTFSSYTYIRRSWKVKVESNIGTARKWNYCFFTNPDDTKTYFYFVTGVEYISDETVELSLEMDVMQSFLLDFTLHRCFVEREHSSSDVVGENLINEGLELGELIINVKSNLALQDYCVVILSSVNLQTVTSTDDVPIANVYDNVFSGLGIFAVDFAKYGQLITLLNNLDDWGKSDCIVSMWMYPKNLVTLATGESWSDSNTVNKVKGGNSFSHSIIRNTQLDGYKPRNKKLLCYPYNFLYVTNNNGGCAVYHYEDFENPDGDTLECRFRVTGSVSAESNIKLYPLSHKNISINYEEGLMGASYPTCAWNQDTYKLWLAQNQGQLATSLIGSGIAIAGGVLAMGTGVGAMAGVGAIASGVMGVASTLAQVHDKDVQPPQARGQHCASVNMNAEHQTFTMMQKSVNSYYARIIDEYFDMYGYKTLRVKVPNRHVRENWTFTKTIDCHVSGNMTNEEIRTIQDCFNRGITFWSDGDNVGSYNLSNSTL